MGEVVNFYEIGGENSEWLDNAIEEEDVHLR